jgi:hypothetical protein
LSTPANGEHLAGNAMEDAYYYTETFRNFRQVLRRFDSRSLLYSIQLDFKLLNGGDPSIADGIVQYEQS